MIGALLRWLRPKRAQPFDTLPDELVCAILARQELDQQDRLKSCALVCHRWHRLVGSADVLRQAPATAEIRFCFTAWAATAPPRRLLRLDALHSWLGRHAEGLHSMRLTVHAYECLDHRSCNAPLADAFQTVQCQLLACLAAAAAGGTLQQLVVQWASFSPLHLGACLAGATRLRYLAVCASQQDGLRLTRGSLAGLPALQSLTLAGALSCRWGRRVTLPPSLTRLVLPLVVDSEDNCLPLQLASLTALRSLEMYFVETDDEGEPDDGAGEELEEEGEEEAEDSDGSDDDSGSESAGEESESESEGGGDTGAAAQGAASSDDSQSEGSSEEEGSDEEGPGGVAGPAAAPGGLLLLAPGSADQSAAGGLFAPLASLGGTLRHLAIQGGSRWPAGLAALTGLQALDLRGAEQWAGGGLQGLQEALSGMTGLTSLILDGVGPLPDRDTLPSLHSLQWAGGSACALEQGPWQRSLRTLCLTGPAAWAAAVRGAPLLAAAPQLEQLLIEDSELPDDVRQSPAWEAFWGWAAAAPRLQQLEELVSHEWPVIVTAEDTAEYALASRRIGDALAALAAARPELRITRLRRCSHGPFNEVGMLWAAGDPQLPVSRLLD